MIPVCLPIKKGNRSSIYFIHRNLTAVYDHMLLTRQSAENSNISDISLQALLNDNCMQMVILKKNVNSSLCVIKVDVWLLKFSITKIKTVTVLLNLHLKMKLIKKLFSQTKKWNCLLIPGMLDISYVNDIVTLIFDSFNVCLSRTVCILE